LATKLQSNQTITKLDDWDFHFWNGLHFKIPLCCIIWYCNVQTNWGQQQGSIYERIFREGYEEIHSLKGSNYDYQMCPECLVTERRTSS